MPFTPEESAMHRLGAHLCLVGKTDVAFWLAEYDFVGGNLFDFVGDKLRWNQRYIVRYLRRLSQKERVKQGGWSLSRPRADPLRNLPFLRPSYKDLETYPPDAF